MLPSTFPFHKYLKYGMEETVMRLLNIHFSVYGYLALILWANYLRSHYIIQFNTASTEADIYICTLGLILNFLTILVKGIVRRIKDDVVIMVTKQTELLFVEEDENNSDDQVLQQLYNENLKNKKYREIKLPKEQDKLFPFWDPDISHQDHPIFNLVDNVVFGLFDAILVFSRCKLLLVHYFLIFCRVKYFSFPFNFVIFSQSTVHWAIN